MTPSRMGAGRQHGLLGTTSPRCASGWDARKRGCTGRRHAYQRVLWACADCSCCEQALSFWGVLEELDLGKRVPDLKGLGFSMLSANDSLTFASNSWNMTLDPQSGRA